MKILWAVVIILLIPLTHLNANEQRRDTNGDFYMSDCGEVFGNKEPKKDCRDDVVFDDSRPKTIALSNVENSYSSNCGDQLAKDCEELQTQ